jgi:hypothetical protein
VPYRDDLAGLIPHARAMEHQGEKFLVFPNDEAETRLARNLGIAVPPPVMTRYDWGGHKPWDVQRHTTALMLEHPRVFVLNEMGTGKTRAAIFACDYMLRFRGAKRFLISAPLSTLTPVWESELFRTFPKYKVRVLHGPRAKRRDLLAEDAQFYIINHHGIPLLTDELVARGFDAVIVDELATLRNSRTDLWKAHATVVGSIPAAWGMTGSPTPMAPTDAWAQVKLLRPTWAPRTMGFFRDQTMARITQFRWVPRPEATEIVHKLMQPAVRFTRDEVMELPATSYVDRKVGQTAEAARVYKALFDRMRTQSLKGKPISAANEGILHNKLLQVACGYLYTDDRTIYELGNKPRFDALDEVLDECSRKAIIFVPYIHALEGLTKALVDAGRSVAMVHGGTSLTKRNKIFDNFQNTPVVAGGTQFIVAHPICMSHGLTLTSANTIVWWAPPASLETYEQANARIIRPGQTSKTLIVHMSGTPVEKLTYARLQQRGKLQGILLDLFGLQELVV